MIRLIIIVVVGLIAGVGGGTGLAVVRAKKSWTADSSTRRVLAESLAVHNDSLGGDSTVAPVAGDSTHAAAPVKRAPAGDSVRAPTLARTDSTTLARKGADSSAKVGGHPPPAGKTAEITSPPISLPPKPMVLSRPGATVPATGGTDTPAAMPTKKIARIFAAMPVKEASRVLEQLDDSDVRTILSSLNEKQAASILSNFPPQRAATISKAAMRAARTAP